MRIVLATSPETAMSKPYVPSIGLGYVAGALEKAGFDLHIFDAHLEGTGVPETVEAILRLRPDAVGITSTSGNRFEAIDIIRGLKEASPGIFVFAGGQHFSNTAEDAMRSVPALDAVVRGEADITAVELINAVQRGWDPSQISGVTARSGGRIVSAPPRPLIEDLDSLGAPAWHLFDLHRYRGGEDRGESDRAIGIISSRGCPNDCNFCAARAFWGRSLRLRDPVKVADEIEFLAREFSYREFEFWDDTLTIRRSHCLALCEEITRRGLDIRWRARGRANTVDKELLEAMKRAGCAVICYGVETGSERILKLMKKGIRLDDVREAVRLTSEAGIKVRTTWILGNAHETEEDLVRTFDFMDEIRSIAPAVSIEHGYLTIYPGTEVERIAVAEGVLPPDFSWNSLPGGGIRREIHGGSSADILFDSPRLPISRIKAVKARLGRTERGLIRTALRYISRIRTPGQALEAASLAVETLKRWRA